MTTAILSGLLLLVFCIGLVFFFKANAGVLFFAACAGLVLLDSLDPSVVTTAGSVVPGVTEAYVRLSVVILSIVFASMMFRNAASGSKFLLHLLLAMLLATMLWLVLPASTGVSWLLENSKDSIWQDVNEFRTLIVASAFSLNLLAILTKPNKHGKKDKH